MPLLVAAIAPESKLITFDHFSSLAMLVILGALSARAGGASVVMGTLRVTF